MLKLFVASWDSLKKVDVFAVCMCSVCMYMCTSCSYLPFYYSLHV